MHAAINLAVVVGKQQQATQAAVFCASPSPPVDDHGIAPVLVGYLNGHIVRLLLSTGPSLLGPAIGKHEPTRVLKSRAVMVYRTIVRNSSRFYEENLCRYQAR